MSVFIKKGNELQDFYAEIYFRSKCNKKYLRIFVVLIDVLNLYFFSSC